MGLLADRIHAAKCRDELSGDDCQRVKRSIHDKEWPGYDGLSKTERAEFWQLHYESERKEYARRGLFKKV